jgi:hypothetical protein
MASITKVWFHSRRWTYVVKHFQDIKTIKFKK